MAMYGCGTNGDLCSMQGWGLAEHHHWGRRVLSCAAAPQRYMGFGGVARQAAGERRSCGQAAAGAPSGPHLF